MRLMNEIGIFICNFNKADMVVKCVQAIKNQTCQRFDLYVVDNASTDNSVELLKQTYGDSVSILQNSENLGGSGGFGRGIRTALELNYKYFMLVDNDAFLDKKAVEYLYEYLEEHEDVGICGAETLYLQDPTKIQDLGGKIDYEHFQWGGIVGGLVELPGESGVILECDYVASCSVMARTSAVRIFGGFPEENFIYWDDIEWCTKCWRAGYKVVVNGNAKALHDMSGGSKRNMFLNYYANRNRYKFFAKYLKEDRLDYFFEYITEEYFSTHYGAIHKGMNGSQTFFNAFDDFMHGITGKAADGKIIPYNDPVNPLDDVIMKAERILIYMPAHDRKEYDCLAGVLRYIKIKNEGVDIIVTFDLEDYQIKDFDVILQLCEHVTRVHDNILPIVYIDKWKNAILNEEDYLYFSGYEAALKRFREKYRPLYQKRIKELRKYS